MKVAPKYKYAKFDMHDKLGKEKRDAWDVELCSHDKNQTPIKFSCC